MKNKKIVTRSMILLVLATIVCGGIYSFSQQKTSKNLEERPQVVSVKELYEENKEGTNYLTGKVIPNEISKINADASKGTISEVHVKVGDQVKKGQKLFTYHNPEGQIALSDAQTEIAKIQNKISLLNQTINDKTAEVNKKTNELAEVNSKITTAKEEEKNAFVQDKKALEESLNNLQSELQSTNSELTDMNLELEKASKNYEVLQGKQNEEEVLSTVDGIVQKIDEKQVNTVNNSGGQTESFMEIMDTSSLKIQGDLDEFRKETVSSGQSIKIIDRKNQKKQWQGKIEKIDAVAKEEKEENTVSKYPFLATIENQENMPTIGSHVYIQPQSSDQKKQMIPLSFVFKEQDKSYVWKVLDGKAVKQEVTVGETEDATERIEIKAGLKEDDKLIVPTSKIKEGLEVA